MPDENDDLTEFLSLFRVLYHILKCNGQLNALAANKSELYSKKDINLNSSAKNNITMLKIFG